MTATGMTPTGSAIYNKLQGRVREIRAGGDAETAARLSSDIAAILAEFPGVRGEMALVHFDRYFETDGQFLREQVTSFRMIKLVVHA